LQSYTQFGKKGERGGGGREE